MKHLKRVYASINKVETQDDGTLKVYGYASSGAVDSDGETITADAMKAALPDYMKFGAVREMHTASAAGTAIHAEVDAAGKTEFAAHVVDPVAVLKVQTGVYKGFSIGGKVTERDPLDKKIIKGLNLVEVSLVDRPANPEALMTMWKAERTDEDDVNELAEMLDAGTVTPAEVLAMVKAAKVGEQSAGGAGPSAVVSTPAASVTDTPAATVDTSAKSDGASDLKKGMYTLSDFASLLNSISYMTCDAAWEAEMEGDNSPLPAALSAWLTSGAAIFQDMVTEEVTELLANVRARANLPDVISMAEKAGLPTDIQKKGATFSAATKAVLADVHKMLNDGVGKMSGLGYDKGDEEEPKESAASTDLTKGQKTPVDDTIGIGEQGDALNKAVAAAIAPINEALEKARKETDDLKGQVLEMSKRAAPGKALLKAVTINKSQDVTKDVDDKDADLAPEGTNARAVQEMNKVFGARR